MKQLHEKTISELGEKLTKSQILKATESTIIIGYDKLKQWAIAKNENCICNTMGRRCEACIQRIRDFELEKESDLK